MSSAKALRIAPEGPTGPTGPNPDGMPAAGLTLGQLRAVIRSEVAHELGAREESPPALIDQKQLARHLGLSERSVYELRQRGCPTVLVLDSPRFELAAVLAWLRSHSSPTP